MKTAWLADQKQHAWNKAYTEMRAKYKVFLPAPETQSTGASGSTARPPDPNFVRRGAAVND